MTPEEFRVHAHALVDWMADYLDRVGSLPVQAQVSPGEVRHALPASPPEDGEPFETIRAEFEHLIMPGITHWNHPGWFAYFPCNNSPPSILAEMLTATLGVQGMSWATSPAATELEQLVMEWLRQLLVLPPGFTGVIQDTASSATLVALLTARNRWSDAPTASLVAYASDEANTSVFKGMRLAGFAEGAVRRIPVDGAYAMRADALRDAMQRDRAAGLTPAAVVATIGTTSSAAIDPVRAIGELCIAEGAWLHVDAAYAGVAALLPECAQLFDGIELADSYVTNPHKWLLTNFDCSAYFVRDTAALQQMFATSPAYLRTHEDDSVVNFREWGIPLGRRFRALKLWFVLRSYGASGLRTFLRTHRQLAASFAARIDAHADFQRLAPVHFGLVAFRHVLPGLDDGALNAHNRSLLDRINLTPDLRLSGTELQGTFALRLSVGQWQTEARHVEHAWRVIQEAAATPGTETRD